MIILTKPQIKDISGQKFNRLLVLPCYKRKKNTTHWLCKCDCGTIKFIDASSLQRDYTKSCGCLKNENIAKKSKIWNDKKVFQSYKTRSKMEKKAFDFVYEDFISLIQKQCFYCGKKPSNLSKTKYCSFVYNGLDRVDNSVGYCFSNCVPCCIECNRMKSNLSQKKFFEHLEKILQHHKG